MLFSFLPCSFSLLPPHGLVTLKAIWTATLTALKAVTSNGYAYLLHLFVLIYYRLWIFNYKYLVVAVVRP